jgi:acyl-CoA synthetase (AMP-forming)/AMP-acid ligase II
VSVTIKGEEADIGVWDAVSRHAATQPDSEAIVEGDVRLTFQMLAKRVDAVAAALMAAGVEPGDRVGTLAPPSIDAFVLFLAVTSIGGIWVGLNPKHRSAELAHVIADSGPTLIFTADGHGAALDAVADTAGITISLQSRDLADWLAAGASISPEALADRRSKRAQRDACMIVYTSGSTGRPKGAVLHHAGILSFARRQDDCWPMTRLCTLNYFPINHVGSICDTDDGNHRGID